MQKKDDPSTPSAAYNKMVPSWDKIRTVLAGTEAMRAAGERYLPRHSAESRRNWNTRIRTAVLNNKSKEILDAWVGRPFSDPVHVGEDVPEAVAALLKDVDLQGNDATVFCREWFREGLAKAFCHVIVDSPVVDAEGRTLDDDRRERVRPFWSLIRPENLIAASTTVVGGREVLTHVRLLERSVERDGYEEREVVRIREFNRELDGSVSVKIWINPDEKHKDDWVLDGSPRLLGIDEIPIVTFYASRSGLLEGTPPLEDVVDLNIAHWQKKSNNDNALTVASFPILAATGIGEEEAKTIVLSPMKLLYSPNPAAKFFYVEHGGAAIAAGRQDVLDLEAQMAEHGAEFLTKRPGTQTATARALDSAESTASLTDAIIRFNDAIRQVAYFTGLWMGLEEGAVGTISVAEDMGPETAEAADLNALGTARARGDISRKRLLLEFQRRGVLGDDFDEEENEEELADEEGDMLTPPPRRGGLPPREEDYKEDEAESEEA